MGNRMLLEDENLNFIFELPLLVCFVLLLKLKSSILTNWVMLTQNVISLKIPPLSQWQTFKGVHLQRSSESPPAWLANCRSQSDSLFIVIYCWLSKIYVMQHFVLCTFTQQISDVFKRPEHSGSFIN